MRAELDFFTLTSKDQTLLPQFKTLNDCEENTENCLTNVLSQHSLYTAETEMKIKNDAKDKIKHKVVE